MKIRAVCGPALAILGTDTGVGKTIVTAAVALSMRRRSLHPVVFKPVASGGRFWKGRLISPDVLWLKRVLRLDLPPHVMNPICYRLPLAPWIAARGERRKFDVAAIRKACRDLRRGASTVLLVEGVGGVLTPISERLTVAGLCARLGLPVLLVGRAGLGTISHTCMSVEALRARGVRLRGIVLNGFTGRDVSERTNAMAIKRLTGVSVLATLPWIPRVRSSRRALQQLARNLDVKP